MNSLFKTISHINSKFCLLVDLNNEHAEASLVLLTNVIFRTIFQVKLSYYLKALCSRDLNNECVENFPVSLMNSLFKTISYIPSNLCLLVDISNEYAEVSPVSLMNGLFKTIFQVELQWLKLCLWWSEQSMCSLSKYHWWMAFSNHLHSKTKTTISIGRPVFWETWTMNVHSRVSPSITSIQPFPDHLPSIALLTQKSSILGYF